MAAIQADGMPHHQHHYIEQQHGKFTQQQYHQKHPNGISCNEDQAQQFDELSQNTLQSTDVHQGVRHQGVCEEGGQCGYFQHNKRGDHLVQPSPRHLHAASELDKSEHARHLESESVTDHRMPPVERDEPPVVVVAPDADNR